MYWRDYGSGRVDHWWLQSCFFLHLCLAFHYYGFGKTELDYFRVKLLRSTSPNWHFLSFNSLDLSYETRIIAQKYSVNHDRPLVFLVEVVVTRQVSSMIHSAWPTVSPVANIIFAWNLFCFEKWGRTACAKTMITGSAEWINTGCGSLILQQLKEVIESFCIALCFLWKIWNLTLVFSSSPSVSMTR